MDTSMSDRRNGLLTDRGMPSAPPGYTYIPTKDGYEIQQDKPGLDSTIATWAQEQPLDAAALASTPIPVVGDIAGLVNDVRHYWNEPDKRTWQNYSLTGIGLLPFMPPAMPISRAAGHLSQAKQTADHARDAGTYESGSQENDMLAKLLRGTS